MGVVSPDISIDLGSDTTPIFVSGQERVYSEPTCLAIDVRQNKVLAVGLKAKAMAGRTLSHIQVVSPVREGVIADFDGAESIIKHLLSLVNAKGILAPRMIVGVPVDASDVECRAAAEAARAAGARTVYIVPHLLASAVGAGLPVFEARGHMIVNIGAETVQAGVISMGDVIVSEGLRWGSRRFDERLTTVLRSKYNHLVDKGSAELLKISAGSAMEDDAPISGNIAGLDLTSGLPRSIELSSNDIAAILREQLEEIVQLLKRILEATPPELAEDIMETGCIMCGGGSLLRGFDRFLSHSTGVYCSLAENPALSVVLGAEMILKDPQLLRTALNRSLVSL